MTNTDTKTATEAAAVATPAAQGVPKKAAAKKTTSKAKGAPTAKEGAKQAAPGKKATTKTSSPAAAREGSKKQIVLALLRRKDGATASELAQATGWQNHSIRGFISGTAAKRLGLTVESTRDGDGTRRYRIAK